MGGRMGCSVVTVQRLWLTRGSWLSGAGLRRSSRDGAGGTREQDSVIRSPERLEGCEREAQAAGRCRRVAERAFRQGRDGGSRSGPHH